MNTSQETLRIPSPEQVEDAEIPRDPWPESPASPSPSPFPAQNLWTRGRSRHDAAWTPSPWSRSPLGPDTSSTLGLAVALEGQGERAGSPGPKYIPAETEKEEEEEEEEEEEVISRFHAYNPSSNQATSQQFREHRAQNRWAPGWTRASRTPSTDSRSLYDTEDEEDDYWLEDEEEPMDEHVARAIRDDQLFTRYFGSGPLLMRWRYFLWDQVCIPFLHGCVWGVVGVVWKWWWKHPRRGRGGGIKL
ncbi:MAG: hypothetical protein DHS80DRAFT_24403 [Piptocephalis tieghemiana]|nr:MAG: hypothetical protein DHS80DRAFT_24403 [Piptocephalis tieghemiana]